ncbi:MAG: acyl-ACP--UDP-N-acetylglucosamine O-acyltransferase [Phycisphaerae bacterium]|nr:acyl-ACP--UDP-N-acetylglucosamine O-acyltransferase [Phycisphaerae bacterium]
MVQVHPSAVVDKQARLAEGVVIGPNCVVDGDVSIGAGTILDANVIISKGVDIGQNNHFFPNCAIGGSPQLLSLKAGDKVGRLVIGDNNVIREQVTIHPSIHHGVVTKIGNNNLIMIGVHIGHDCIIEDKVVMSNYVQVSGHCRIETGVWLSGVVLLHQFVTVGKWCYAAGLAGINKDVPPFLIVSGHYPPTVRGVNKRGLARAGLSEQQQKKIDEAYRKLYRKGGALLENAKAMYREASLTGEQEDGLDENVRAMLEAIIRSSEQRFGRYLEKFR